MCLILAIVVLLVLVDFLRHRQQGSPARSVAVRAGRNRVALMAGVAVFVLSLVLDLAISGASGSSLLLAVLLGLVVALLVAVTTGGGGPLGKRTGRGGGRTVR